MWTDITREQHARKGLRLPSDLTDAEWAIFEPLMPIASTTGRPMKWTCRELLDAMLYLLRGGLAWRMLPPGLFPPVSTVQRWFYIWRDNGLWRAINHELVMMVRLERDEIRFEHTLNWQDMRRIRLAGIHRAAFRCVSMCSRRCAQPLFA